MCRRPLLVLAVMLACAGVASRTSAATVTMLFFPLTGEVRMQNISTVPFEFIYYSITSPSGSLNGANGVWKSIDDTYDVSGNGFIDPVNDWTELSASSTELTEGVFVGATPGILPASRTISLGKIWNPAAAPMPDVEVQVIQSDNQAAIVDEQYTLDGDYNLDDEVTNQDYTMWKSFYGVTFAPFIDGNLNGVIDAGDYTVWRDNFGASLLGTAFASESAGGGSAGLAMGTAVPEPATAGLVFLAACALFRRYWTRSRTA